MRRFCAKLTIWLALVLSAVLTALIAVGYSRFVPRLLVAEALGRPAAALLAGVLGLLTAGVLGSISPWRIIGLGVRDRKLKHRAAAETAAGIGKLYGDQVKEFAQMNRGTSL